MFIRSLIYIINYFKGIACKIIFVVKIDLASEQIFVYVILASICMK